MERRKRRSVSRSKGGSSGGNVYRKRKVQRKKRTARDSFFLSGNIGLFLGCAFLVCAIIFVLSTGLDFKKSSEKKEDSGKIATNMPENSGEKTKQEPLPSRTEKPVDESKKSVESKNNSSPPSSNRLPEKKNIPPSSEKKNPVEKNRLAPEAKRPSSETPTLKNENPAPKKKNERKKNEFSSLPAAKNNAVLVFLFDDAGQNLNQLEKFLALPFPFTVAVLPRLVHSKEAAERIRKSGNELMLHQPMQAINLRVNPGEGAITPNMDEDEIRSVLFTNIYEIGPISGVNNHEGSLITSDAQKMSYVMKFLSEEGLYFLDSRTSADTKVPYVAKEMGYSYYQRNVFLDNSGKREDMIMEIKKGLEYANKTGCAIMIGHIWSSEVLPSLLIELYPVLLEKGYKFSKVSECPSKIGI